MGASKSKSPYKTKGILEIFLWYANNQGYNTYKCNELAGFSEKFESEELDLETFQAQFPIPFELVSTDNKVELINLEIALLLLCNDDQGSRIDFFKSLTNDPEQLIHYFRWKYELIYSRIPELLINLKLLDPVAGKEFIAKKAANVYEMSNFRYNQYTTSSCNILKFTMLKT